MRLDYSKMGLFTKRKSNIKKSLLSKYGISSIYIEEVSDILANTAISEDKLINGDYDSVVAMTIKFVINKKNNLIELKAKKKEKIREKLKNLCRKVISLNTK